MLAWIRGCRRRRGPRHWTCYLHCKICQEGYQEEDIVREVGMLNCHTRGKLSEQCWQRYHRPQSLSTFFTGLLHRAADAWDIFHRINTGSKTAGWRGDKEGIRDQKTRPKRRKEVGWRTTSRWDAKTKQGWPSRNRLRMKILAQREVNGSPVSVNQWSWLHPPIKKT